MYKPFRFIIGGFCLLAVVSIFNSTFAKNLNPPWVPIASGAVDGTVFYYHAEGIRFFGMPPQVVKLHIVSVKDQKMSAADQYEAICGNKSIIINNSAPLSVASENSVRRLILESVCGFSDGDGRWLGLWAWKDLKDNAFGTWFFDITSIRKTSNPFLGQRVRAVLAAANLAVSDPFTYQTSSIIEWVYRCDTPRRLVYKSAHADIFQPETAVAPLGQLDGVIRILCSGHFQVAEMATPTNLNRSSDRSTNSLTIEDAKLKCSELGFKPGSENYGDCVLKLSQ